MKKKVTVSVDTIMSKCGGNCDFNWDSSATPTVTAIDTSNFVFRLKKFPIIN